MEPSSFWERFNRSTYCLGGCSSNDEDGQEEVSCPNCPWPTMCGDEDCWNEGSPHDGRMFSIQRSRNENDTRQTKAVEAHSSPTDHFSPTLHCSQRAGSPQMGEIDEDGSQLWRSLLLETKSEARPSGSRRQSCQRVDGRCKNSHYEGFDRKALRRILSSQRFCSVTCDFLWAICKLNVVFNSMTFMIYSNFCQGVYSVASRIAYSCVANVTATFNGEGKITVRTAVPILEGTKMVYTYHCTPWWDSADRHMYLRNILGTTFGFGCSCERCKDSSELGSFVGGVYCPKCPDKEGCLLPVDPKRLHASWFATNAKKILPAMFGSNMLNQC